MNAAVRLVLLSTARKVTHPLFRVLSASRRVQLGAAKRGSEEALTAAIERKQTEAKLQFDAAEKKASTLRNNANRPCFLRQNNNIKDPAKRKKVTVPRALKLQTETSELANTDMIMTTTR